ncbi:hypothetical protein ACO0SA_003054 [Hanseniaspora valbyensis]
MRKHRFLKIAVIGDEGVGKTTFISGLLNPATQLLQTKTFNEINDSKKNENNLASRKIPKQLPPLTIPTDNFPDFTNAPETTTFIDTSDNTFSNETLKQVDALLLLYSNLKSYNRIYTHWMPQLRRMGVNIPIVVLKNEFPTLMPVTIDSMTSQQKGMNKDTEMELIMLTSEFKEISSTLSGPLILSNTTTLNSNNNNNNNTTSTNSSLSLFYTATYHCIRAVVYPLPPIYDYKTAQLKEPCYVAMMRIFTLADTNMDGVLDFKEMAALQEKCFGKGIDMTEFKRICLEVKMYALDDGNEEPNDNNEEINPFFSSERKTNANIANNGDVAVVENVGITRLGFLLLLKIYIERGRFETIWGLLRGYNYNDTLQISDDLLYPKFDVSVEDACFVELSSNGYRFLVDVFRRYDKDNDGGLNDSELRKLFKLCPNGEIPTSWINTNFPDSCTTDNDGNVNLSGWLAQWAMTTFLDYKTTTKFLVYLGYQGDPKTCLRVTKQRKVKKRHGKFYRAPVSDRKVFNCFLIGKPGSGKSSLLKSFANKDDLDIGSSYHNYYSPTMKPSLVINSLELADGKQYYLILQEFGQSEFEVIENEKKWDQCDVLCLCYDSSDPESFSYILRIMEKYPHLQRLPIIVVGLKADLDTQDQRCFIQPDEYCESLSLDHPLRTSVLWPSSLLQLFTKVVNASLEPLKATSGFEVEIKPETFNDEFKEQISHILTAFGVITVLSYGAYKMFNRK